MSFDDEPEATEESGSGRRSADLGRCRISSPAPGGLDQLLRGLRGVKRETSGWPATSRRFGTSTVWLGSSPGCRRRIETEGGRGRYECDPKKLLTALIDFEAKAGVTNLASRQGLRGHSPGRGRTRTCWSATPFTSTPMPIRVKVRTRRDRCSNSPGSTNEELRRGTEMEEKYTQMVKTATWLGDSIGKALAHAVLGGRTTSRGGPDPENPSPRRALVGPRAGFSACGRPAPSQTSSTNWRGSSSDTRSMFPRMCLTAMSFAPSSSRSFADSASSPR